MYILWPSESWNGVNIRFISHGVGFATFLHKQILNIQNVVKSAKWPIKERSADKLRYQQGLLHQKVLWRKASRCHKLTQQKATQICGASLLFYLAQIWGKQSSISHGGLPSQSWVSCLNWKPIPQTLIHHFFNNSNEEATTVVQKETRQ